MNRNLFLKEIKRNRKNLFIWSAIVIGFTLMVLTIFPYMSDMGEGFAKLMEKMPVEITKAMGMDEQTWSSILGFYSTYYGVYIVVLISIYTSSTGAGIVSKEEKDRTSEFLMTRPISRKSIFTTKMWALFVLCLFIYMVQTITAIIGITLFKTSLIDWAIFAKMHLGGFILMLFFTAIGVLISMFVTPKKNFMGIVVGLTFGTYFLNALAKSTDATAWIGYFSPFHYMEFTIDPGYNFNYLAAGLLIITVFICLFIAFRQYKKRDIVG